MIEAWPTVSESLSMIKTDEDLERRQALLDLFLEEVGDDDQHPHADIALVLGLLVEDYEAQNADKRGDPVATIVYLMTEHGLEATDLIPELGSLEEISAILNAEKDLTRAQIIALSKRFDVSPLVFL